MKMQKLSDRWVLATRGGSWAPGRCPSCRREQALARRAPEGEQNTKPGNCSGKLGQGWPGGLHRDPIRPRGSQPEGRGAWQALAATKAHEACAGAGYLRRRGPRVRRRRSASLHGQPVPACGCHPTPLRSPHKRDGGCARRLGPSKTGRRHGSQWRPFGTAVAVDQGKGAQGGRR